MVIEYLAYQLIDGYKSGDVNVTSFLDYYDFYLVPFHNPDGRLLCPGPIIVKPRWLLSLPFMA
jgi:murein tripeptide amidase MpaA